MPRYPSHRRLQGLISFCRICSWWIVMTTNLTYAFNTFCNSIYLDIWQRLYSNWCLDIMLDPSHQRLQGLISFCRICSWWIVMATNLAYAFNTFCNSMYPDIWQRLYSNWCLDIILDPSHQRLQGLISFCRIKVRTGTTPEWHIALTNIPHSENAPCPWPMSSTCMYYITCLKYFSGFWLSQTCSLYIIGS